MKLSLLVLLLQCGRGKAIKAAYHTGAFPTTEEATTFLKEQTGKFPTMPPAEQAAFNKNRESLRKSALDAIRRALGLAPNAPETSLLEHGIPVGNTPKGKASLYAIHRLAGLIRRRIGPDDVQAGVIRSSLKREGSELEEKAAFKLWQEQYEQLAYLEPGLTPAELELETNSCFFHALRYIKASKLGEERVINMARINARNAWQKKRALIHNRSVVRPEHWEPFQTCERAGVAEFKNGPGNELYEMVQVGQSPLITVKLEKRGDAPATRGNYWLTLTTYRNGSAAGMSHCGAAAWLAMSDNPGKLVEEYCPNGDIDKHYAWTDEDGNWHHVTQSGAETILSAAEVASFRQELERIPEGPSGFRIEVREADPSEVPGNCSDCGQPEFSNPDCYMCQEGPDEPYQPAPRKEGVPETLRVDMYGRPLPPFYNESNSLDGLLVSSGPVTVAHRIHSTDITSARNRAELLDTDIRLKQFMDGKPTGETSISPAQILQCEKEGCKIGGTGEKVFTYPHPDYMDRITWDATGVSISRLEKGETQESMQVDWATWENLSGGAKEFAAWKDYIT